MEKVDGRRLRGQAISEAQRRKIQDAAMVMFAWHGYTAATVTQIAEEAGVSHGSVLRYFSSKEDLFRATILEGLAYVSEVSRLTLAHGRMPEARLRSWAIGYTHTITVGFLYSRLVMQVLGAPGSHPADLAPALENYWKSEIAAVGNVLGLICSDQNVAHQRAWLAVTSIIGMRMSGVWYADPEHNTELVYPSVCQMLGIAPDPRPEPVTLPPLPWETGLCPLDRFLKEDR